MAGRRCAGLGAGDFQTVFQGGVSCQIDSIGQAQAQPSYLATCDIRPAGQRQEAAGERQFVRKAKPAGFS